MELQVAVFFTSDEYDIAEDIEWVLCRPQMLTDVFYHEHDPLPSFEDFKYRWLTRPNDQKFWVYRSGTKLDTYILDGRVETIVLQAKKSELDADQASGEGYHHVKSISLDGAHPFHISGRQPNLREQAKFIEDLYERFKAQIEDVA